MKRALKSSPLTLSALTPTALPQLADAKSFARGQAYFADGRVGLLSERSGRIVAIVHGSESYSVELWQEGAELEYDCSCPRGAEGDFCKHCVAVGLTLLAGQWQQSASRRSSRRELNLDDVRRHLEGETKAVLVKLLIDRAASDASLFDLLRLRVAKQHRRGAVDVEAFKAVLRRTIAASDFLDWREVRSHVERIDRVVDSLEELITDGNAAGAVELAEYALQEVEQAMGSVDDSGGDMGGLLRRLEEVHHRACMTSKPDVIALANRLFHRELGSDFDVFYGAAARYADVLGKAGIAEYRRLAEELWDKVPALGPGQSDRAMYGGRFRITSIMRTLAQQAGDIEAEVQVMKRDLSLAYHFLAIATLYRQAGKDDLALDWAEKGVQAFPTHTDGRLREFLADEYHRRKRHDDALALAWASFSEHPTLENYQLLKGHADRAKNWSLWRQEALDYIRQLISKNRGVSSRPAWEPVISHSLLVEIYLAEKNPEAAWQEAVAGGCSPELWLALADKREKTHPADALPIYKRQLESALSQSNNSAYETGVRLLKKIYGTMSRMGQRKMFETYLVAVRAAHFRKRNFIRLLEGTRWA